MTAAALELQEAVFTALVADAALVAALGGPRFHDLTPAGLAFPYITFARATAYDWGTGTEGGSEHLFTLHVWSKHKGRKEALTLVELARAALHDRVLALATRSLVNLRLESSEVRHDEDLDAYQGTLHFRAIVEP